MQKAHRAKRAAAADKAKRQSASSKPVASAPSGMKRLTLDIPPELHRAIKMSAAHEGVTMVEKLRSLLMQHFAAELST
jgi:predicted HicB family RNase H-like nuclease